MKNDTFAILQEQLFDSYKNLTPVKEPVKLEIKHEVKQEEIPVIPEPDDLVTHEILETVKAESKPKVSFWCKRCQRGLGGVLYKCEDYDEGDNCPMCLDMFKSRKIAEHDIEKLVEIGRYQREHVEEGLRKRKERLRKANKGVKGAEELIRNTEDKFKSKIDSQAKQIERLTTMVEKLTNQL